MLPKDKFYFTSQDILLILLLFTQSCSSTPQVSVPNPGIGLLICRASSQDHLKISFCHHSNSALLLTSAHACPSFPLQQEDLCLYFYLRQSINSIWAIETVSSPKIYCVSLIINFPVSNFILNLRGKKKKPKQISSISHKTKQQYQRNYNTLLLDFINFSVVYFCSYQRKFFLKDVYFYCVFMLVGAGPSFPPVLAYKPYFAQVNCYFQFSYKCWTFHWHLMQFWSETQEGSCV